MMACGLCSAEDVYNITLSNEDLNVNINVNINININVDLPEISFTKEEYYVGEGDGVVVVVLERYEGITWSVSVTIKILSSQVATASGKKLFVLCSYSRRMSVNICLLQINSYDILVLVVFSSRGS